ncbi:MAG: thioredoxin domain-containing protein, partial [Planctomycetota bacterium]
YSACHWCHVMAHECFENEAISAQMNRDFVNIKIDREERPDIDEIYMTATQLISGSGGWPMSVFLNHDLTPFFAGTYFPPVSKFGRISFPMLLDRLIKLWKEDRAKIQEQGKQILQSIHQFSEMKPGEETLSYKLPERAVNLLKKRFDSEKGGFSSAPKFPDSQGILLLLRHHALYEDSEALKMVEKTLDEMALGGIYDHLGGGFARYSVDEEWFVPHFEKMLYDNAMLPRAYLAAAILTKNSFYRGVVVHILDFILREMTDPSGAFYSAQDADSEGEEGKFYVWTLKEIQTILGAEDAQLFAKIYQVTPEGNWENHNILHLRKPLQEYASDQPNLAEKMANCRKKLFEVRSKRIRPGLDDKILTEWNGLMITTMAQAGAVLQEERFVQAASKAAHFLYQRMRLPDGTLLRVYRQGQSHTSGYQADYASYAEACLALFQATFDSIWLSRAEEIVQKMNELFWDEQEGGYFYTTANAVDVIARSKHPYDNPFPSGNTMAVSALQQLYRLTEKPHYLERIEKTIQAYQGSLESQSFGFHGMLGQVQEWLAPKLDIVIVGEYSQHPLLKAARQYFIPGKMILALNPQSLSAEFLKQRVPAFQDRNAIQGKLTVYICRNQTCLMPIFQLQDLEKALAQKGTTDKKNTASKLVQLALSPEAIEQLKRILAELEPEVALKIHFNPQEEIEITAIDRATEKEVSLQEGIPLVLDPKFSSKASRFTLNFEKGSFFLKIS